MKTRQRKKRKKNKIKKQMRMKNKMRTKKMMKKKRKKLNFNHTKLRSKLLGVQTAKFEGQRRVS